VAGLLAGRVEDSHRLGQKFHEISFARHALFNKSGVEFFETG
jgi:hypothetical protein